jgi:hypothetical protein
MNNAKKLEKEERLFREEMNLRRAVSSAAIEGNTLTVLEYKLSTLSARRREIYNLIEKHPYDIKKLQEKWLIIKIGETRGVTYKIKNAENNA